MPDLQVGGGGGGIGGIPTRYVLIGAGVLGVGAILMMQKRAPATAPADGNVASYGTALGPNAAIALGSLDTETRQKFGDLEQQLHDQFTKQGEDLSGMKNYEEGLQQTVLGLYTYQQQQQGWTPRQTAAWLREKFPLYQLGTIPPGYFGPDDPVQ